MKDADALAQQRIDSGLVMPVTGEQMAVAITAYRGLQKALDESMPDQIIDLDGKQFRKKGYWRAVALAFKLSVEPTDERHQVSGQFLDGRDNFGYLVTYKASHSSGRQAFGDGSCFAVEKARRFKCPHPESAGSKRTLHFPHNTCPEFDANFQWRVLPGDATEHNVRSHAHTRAFNRAVSNLVGFGEVSAEEVEREEPHHAGSSSTAATEAKADMPAPVVDPLGNTTVRRVTTKDGRKKNGDKYVLYMVEFADGRKGSTFSESVGRHAENAKRTDALVHPVIEKEGEYFTLKEFGPIAKAPEPQAPDEPVDGPEKILTVREAKTASGSRWMIQTSKRQVIATDEVLATQAVEARKANVGMVPLFEVVAGDKGALFNRLTNWQPVEEPAMKRGGIAS